MRSLAPRRLESENTYPRRLGMFSDFLRDFLRQGMARADSCSLKIPEIMKFFISDGISDFAKCGNFEFQISRKI